MQKYADANLDAPDNAISDNESSSEMLTRSINNKPKSVFSDTDVTEHLADLHNRYVIVPADKASNNVVFVCKTYYFECLQRELVDSSI